MASGEDLLMRTRANKINSVRSLGIEPYPYLYKKSKTAALLKSGYLEGLFQNDAHKLAGRLMSYRDHGKSAFANVQDESGEIQVYFDKISLPEIKSHLLSLLDRGDFIGAEGTMFLTKRSEPTLRVRDYDLLSKATRPLPEKWHGLQDPELKYRRRTEFLVTKPEQRENFKKRSKAISAMREFLDRQGFLEVETPLIQQIYGGASARPFKTYVNSLEEENYLSISPEIYLKRLVAGGFERVYTICKNFRNEGIDRIHNPEFTMMECYQAYADYHDMMSLTENLYAYIFDNVLGSCQFKYADPESSVGSVTINVAPPWKRISMLESAYEYSGIDAGSLSREELRKRALEIREDEFFRKIVPREHVERWSWGELVQGIFSYY